jgi:hypothetical protein
MAIPPKEGHYTIEDFQLRVDQANANIQWLTSQLAAMKAHPELAKNFVGNGDTLPVDPDKPAKPPGGYLGDKPGPGRK